VRHACNTDRVLCSSNVLQPMMRSGLERSHSRTSGHHNSCGIEEGHGPLVR
jgi:hypothetical protein